MAGICESQSNATTFDAKPESSKKQIRRWCMLFVAHVRSPERYSVVINHERWELEEREVLTCLCARVWGAKETGAAREEN